VQPKRPIWTALVLIVVALMVFEFWDMKPPTTVTVVTGQTQGSLYRYAQSYSKALEQVSSDVELTPFPQTLILPKKVNEFDGGQAIGFAVVNHDTRDYPNVRSLGVIDTQPLFIFVRQGKSGIQDIGDLRGRRIILPTEGSAAANAALAVMRLLDLSKGDITVEHRPLQEVAQALDKLEFDAGFLMLAADHPLITKLLMNPSLKLLDLPLHEAISHRLDFLVPMTMSAGVINLGAKVPESNLRLVGAPVDLIVHKDLHPALVHALLDKLSETHGGQSLLERRGTYPIMAGSQWPMHPAAVEYARDGTPWIYKRLYPWLAAALDEYWPLMVILIGLATLYDGFDNFMGFVRTTRYFSALAIVSAVYRLGQHSTRPQQPWLYRVLCRLAEYLLQEESASHRAKQLLSKTEELQRKA